jgi:hypothetical protein
MSAQFPIRKLLKAGFQADSVLQDVLHAVERRLFSELRWNARIEVKNGAFLLGKPFPGVKPGLKPGVGRAAHLETSGIADEVGVLAPNEVFCQIDTEDGEQRVITGTCIVCRAPACT